MTILTSGLLVIWLLSKRQSYSDGRPGSRSRFDIERASEYADAFGYADEPESAVSILGRRGRDRSHPFSVVFDGDAKFVFKSLYDDERLGRLRVFNNVVQALLHD